MKTTTILKIIFHFYIASLLVISPFFLIIGESDPEDTLFTMDENSERYVSPEAKSEAIGKNVDGKVDLAKTRGSVRAEPEDPVWVEISDGLWEVSWNFTSSAAYVLDSVVLNNGSAELARENGSLSFTDVSAFQNGQFSNTSTDHLDRLVLQKEKEFRFFIADKNNHRVLELNQGYNWVWQYGQNGSSGTTAGLMHGPQSVELLPSDNILITDTLNHRVIEVNRSNSDSIEWQFGVTGTAGSGPNDLDTPTYSRVLDSGDILVADASNHQVVEINYKTQNKGWTYGSGVPGDGNNQLKVPSSAQRLENGTTLIADRANHRVILVDNTKKVLWQYGDSLSPGFGDNQLTTPGFAILSDNNTVFIADTTNQRVIEVDFNKNKLWQYGTSGLSGTSEGFLTNPEKVYQLPGGNLMIVDSNNHRILEISRENKWVWQYGQNSSAGYTNSRLDLPMDFNIQQLKYGLSGNYTSAVLDAGRSVLWMGFESDQLVPPDCSLEYYARIGATNVPDGTWSAWDGPFYAADQFSLNSIGERYIQFRIIMSTTNITISPRVGSLTFNYQNYARTGNITLCNCIENRIIQFQKLTTDVQTNGQIVNYYYSTDNGSTWVSVPTNHSLKNVDSNNDMIRLKIELLTTDYVLSPRLDEIAINYTTFGSLTSIDVVPNVLNISAGEKFEDDFIAVGFDSRGNSLDILPTWTTTVGTMSDAEFTAQTKVGSGFVNATIDSITGSCPVNVIPNDLDVIKIKPERVNVTAGGVQEFTATGYDKHGNEKEVEVEWSTTVGTMIGSVLRAQLDEGQGIVVATNGTKFGVAIVDVQFDYEHPPPEIRGAIPNQVYPEDSPPWQLKLTPFEFDLDDSGTYLNWYVTGVNTDLFYVSGEYHADDVLTFTPIPNAVGDTQITLWLEDRSGFAVSKNIWVNLTPVNDKPWLSRIPDLELRKDEDYSFDFSPYIRDIDNALSELTLYTFSAMGLNYISLDGFEATINYPWSFEKNRDIITLTVSDGSEFSEDLFLINFTDNRPPAMTSGNNFPKTASFWEDKNKTVVDDINKYFEDPDGISLTYWFNSKHIKSELIDDALIISTKKANWHGLDTLFIRVYDGQGSFKEAPIQVIVIPVNDGPEISKLPNLDVHYNTDFEFDLTGFIHDIDNATSDLTVVTHEKDSIRLKERKPHILIINYSRIMSGFEFEVNITVSDGLLQSSETLVIYVSDNHPPSQLKAFRPLSFFEDQVMNDHFNLGDYFYDIDGPAAIFSVMNKTINVDIDSNGFVDFWAPENWYGQENIIFFARDNLNSTNLGIVNVTVIPVNDEPVLADIESQSGSVDSLWVLDLSSYISDPDNSLEELSFELDQPKGYAILHGSSILFNYNQEATEALTVTVTDGYDTGSTSFVVSFTGGGSEDPGPGDDTPAFEMFATWIFIIMVMVIINAGGLSIYYFKYKGRYKLEDLFLIHANGNLIAHVGGTSRIYTDNEILSGMLTAIQDFIKDGFSESDSGSDDWSLDHLKFGDRNIYIERGDYMYIAAVFKGDIGWKLKRELNDCLKEIDTDYSKILKKWTGTLDGLGGINKILSKKFKALAPKEKRRVYKRESAEDGDEFEEPELVEELGPELPDKQIPEDKPAVSKPLKTTPSKPAPLAKPVSPEEIGPGKPPLALAEPAPVSPLAPIISYIFGGEPEIPRPLSDREKIKLPRTKPISKQNQEADWRRIDV